MKKYLVRGGMDPLAVYQPKDVLKSNYIGGNSGNMLFLYGVINALTTENASCDITNRKSRWSDAEIDAINGKYDAVILPMADAFRADYASNLRDYTNFIKKLKIPCVVIGVGLREEYEPQLDQKKPFDEDVKAFVKEVLAHSARIGLRGEFTGQYLANLGFTPDRDFIVIGCPSLYMHGTAIEKREPGYDLIGVNLNAIASDTINDFYVHLLKTNKNTHVFQQRGVEFIDWYYGKSVSLSTFVPEYPPRDIFKELDFQSMKKEGRVHFFLDVPSWLEYVKQFGVFVGCRFHGIVAAILAGVPAAISPIDARTREFALFHHIPQLKKQDMMDKRTLEECFRNLDLSDFHVHHTENMKNYLSFLSANGLESIFDTNVHMPFGASPLEKQIVKRKMVHIYEGYDHSGVCEKAYRFVEYQGIQAKAKLKKAIKR